MKYMRLMVIVLLLALTSANALAAEAPAHFLGKWRSDAAKTLEDVRRHPEIPQKARDILENDFFGHLELVITPTGIESHYAHDGQTMKSSGRIIRARKDYIVTKYTVAGRTEKKRLYFEDGYIYVYSSSKWGFKEYFRKVG